MHAVLQCIRSVVFVTVLFMSSLLGALFFSYPLYLCPMFFMPEVARFFGYHLIGSWLYFCAALLEKMMGVKVVITGDTIRPSDRCLFIMNHKTRLDWMYFWSVLVRQSNVKAEKIILKSELKHIPGAGWAMQLASFIFVKRKWSEDQEILSKMIDYFAMVRQKPQILIFPEGTDLTERSTKRSNEFAEKNNLPFYQHVLHPRTMGFSYAVQRMRQNRMLDAVYDVTVAYPYNCPQTEPELIMGNVPREVHFHIQRYPAREVPEEPEEVQTWCKERWAEKEHQLHQYYTKGRLFQSPDTRNAPGQTRDSLDLKLYIAMIYWTLFIVGIILMLVYSSLVRWYMVFQTLFFLVMGYIGGFELFKADYTAWLFGSKKRT